MNAQVTNSIEIQANMDPWLLRTTLNAVNAPPKTNPDHIDIVDGYTYKRETEYQGIVQTYNYKIYKDNKLLAVFNNMQYPSCCGISILYGFNASHELPDNFNDILLRFFQLTSSQWKPNIQFVAVKQCLREEEYDEDDDEYYDKIIGICDDYDYKEFITALQLALQPTLLSSFVNKNSDNQCDLYQAVNPFRR